MSNIFFICQNCSLCVRKEAASNGCSNCASNLFKVAYGVSNPYGEGRKYRGTPKDPYHRDPDEDGYNLVTPFSNGDMSQAALGPEGLSSDALHEPGDPFDRDGGFGNAPVSSDNFFPDNSPMRAVNQHEPKHIGPHNMPHFNGTRHNADIFDRVRRRRK